MEHARSWSYALESKPDQPVDNLSPSLTSKGIPPALGCSILLVMLVLGLACLWLAGTLAFEGQVLLRAGQPDELRLWLVQDGELAGVGFSYALQEEVPGMETLTCYQTRVRFVLWKNNSEGQPAEYCRCYRSRGGEWIDAGACDGS
jgi:hypothetical protein